MNLNDPTTLQEFLKRHRLLARKGLGQHFLCSQKAIAEILGCLYEVKGVLEIGPGPGVLTRPLAGLVDRVIALEVDPEMVKALADSAPTADVRRTDALKANLGAILTELPSPRAIVSNLPYYITGPLVIAIAEARPEFERAVLMMQREVGERFMAKPGDSDRGSISVYLQACFELRKVANVPAAAFIPPPKVDSMILELIPKTNAAHSEKLFDFIRQGFTQPRKTLVNNLSGYRKESVQESLTLANLDTRIRPHEMTFEQWQSLFDGLERSG